MAELERAQVVEYLKKISLLEASELVKELEQVFGVSAAAPMAMPAGFAGAGASPAAGGAPAEEKTEFEVILKASGNDKIKVIKVVRAATGLGLKEAKDLVEAAPKSLKTGISKDDAEKLKKELTEVGATVEVK